MASALQLRVNVPQYLLTRAATLLCKAAPASLLGGVRLVEQRVPELPASDWVRLEPIATGICGTDLATLAFSGPKALEPFASFPAVLGHEVLARVAELGAGVSELTVGDRVVVDPLIHCGTRGVPKAEWCGSCKGAVPGACERAGERGPLCLGGAPLSRGNFMGFHSGLPGGFSSAMLAPASQVFRVPAQLTDRQAVLTEPLSVAVHAVVRAWEQLGQRVLVVGSGPIAIGAAWALRALGYGGSVVAQAKRDTERQLLLQLGVDRVVRPGAELREQLVRIGSKTYKPLIGPEVYTGGFDTVFDCVGSAQSLDEALRVTAAGGQVVMLGCCTHVPDVDFTFLWARQLCLRGFIAYGPESWQGKTQHTFELTLELLTRHCSPIAELVTHEFPLSEYRAALAALYRRAQSGALKVILRP